MKYVIRVANKNISINSVYSNAYLTCKDYLVDGDITPDIELNIDDSMIRAEERGIEEHQEKGPKSIEGLLVYRLIAEKLLRYDTFLMHGAVIAYENVSYLFTGPSGTGKTTHIQKWLTDANNSFIVNGDKPLVIVGQNCAFACGTPWCGKEHLGTNTIVKLRSIVFMERSSENYIEAVPFRSIFPKLLEQTYMPADADKMKKTLELLMKLKSFVTFYRFRFNNFKEDAFRTSFDVLTKQELH